MSISMLASVIPVCPAQFPSSESPKKSQYNEMSYFYLWSINLMQIAFAIVAEMDGVLSQKHTTTPMPLESTSIMSVQST